MYYCYILRSLKDGSFYYGSTKNIDARLKEHNSGKVRYTKGHLSYVIHYREECETRSEAVQRERFFKTIDGYKWLKENKVI